MKNLLLLAAIFSAISLNAQTTLVLQPDASTGNDTYVFDDFPNTSYGTENRIDITSWTASGSPYISRGLVEFDLSSIPVGTPIVSAHLSLYHHPTHPFYNGIHSGANDFIIQRITTPWDEITATWNNQPSTTTANQILMPATTSGTQDFINVDVTPMVTAMINAPGTSYGFMIRLQVEVYYRDLLFASSNHADPTVRPMLVIQYLTTGIEEAANDINISAYPNPFNDVLNVETSGSGVSEIFVYDVQSRKLIHQAFEKTISLDTRSLSSGIYFYEVRNAKGNSRVGKILKD